MILIVIVGLSDGSYAVVRDQGWLWMRSLRASIERAHDAQILDSICRVIGEEERPVSDYAPGA